MKNPDGSTIRMSEVYIDGIISSKYQNGDIVMRRVFTRSAKEIYDMLKLHNHSSVEDVMRMVFRNTQNSLLYSKDLSAKEDHYCTVNFDEFGYIEEVIKQGNWNPEYKIKWETRDEKVTYAGKKPTIDGTWGQEFLIGMKDLKLMTELEIKQDVLGNAWKFIPNLEPLSSTAVSTSPYTNNITIHHKIK